MRILALLNLLSKVSIGNKSLKRSIMNLLKLHSEAEGAGVVTGIKKSYPKANGVTLLCVLSSLWCLKAS